MSYVNDELFSRAVKMLREKKHSSLEIIDTIEHDATGNVDGRSIVNDAQKYVQETDEEAFKCAVQAFKQGQSHFEVTKKLIACGLHPFDSGILASKAKAQAEKELAEESLRLGLSELAQESK